MKTRISSFAHTGMLLVLLVAVTTLGAASPALAGKGNAGNQGIIPPHAHAHGKPFAD